MDGTFIVTNLHRIIWGSIKAVFLTLILFHLFNSVLSYPAFPDDGEVFNNILSWLSSFVSAKSTNS